MNEQQQKFIERMLGQSKKEGDQQIYQKGDLFRKTGLQEFIVSP